MRFQTESDLKLSKEVVLITCIPSLVPRLPPQIKTKKVVWE